MLVFLFALSAFFCGQAQTHLDVAGAGSALVLPVPPTNAPPTNGVWQTSYHRTRRNTSVALGLWNDETGESMTMVPGQAGNYVLRLSVAGTPPTNLFVFHLGYNNEFAITNIPPSSWAIRWTNNPKLFTPANASNYTALWNTNYSTNWSAFVYTGPEDAMFFQVVTNLPLYLASLGLTSSLSNVAILTNSLTLSSNGVYIIDQFLNGAWNFYTFYTNTNSPAVWPFPDTNNYQAVYDPQLSTNL